MIQDTKASATSQQAVGSWEAAGIELNIQGSTAAIIGQLRKDMQQKNKLGGGAVFQCLLVCGGLSMPSVHGCPSSELKLTP